MLQPRRILIIGGLMLAFLLVDLGIPRSFDLRKPYVAVVLLGLCAGQLTMIAIWAALAPGSVLLRLPWALSLGTLMWYGLILGNHLRAALSASLFGMRGRFYEPSLLQRPEALTLGVMVLTSVIVLQVPFWLMNLVFRWKLVWAEDPHGLERHQFNLRHLIAGTILFAILLAIGREIMPKSGTLTLVAEREMWQLYFVALSVATALVSLPAATLVVLGAQRRLLLTLGWVVYTILLSIAEYSLLSLLLGTPPASQQAESRLMILLLQFAHGGSVIVSLLVLSFAGLRLARLRRTVTMELPQTN